MTSLDSNQLSQLQTKLNSADVAGFYTLLDSYGDSYGRLGYEITTNSGWQGVIANNFAAYAAAKNNIDMSYGSALWDSVNANLAQAYLNVYVDNQGAVPDWNEIKNIHNLTYQNASISIDAWFPNRMLENAANPSIWDIERNPEELWDDWLSNDGGGDLLEDLFAVLSAGGYVFIGNVFYTNSLRNGIDQQDMDFAESFLNAFVNMDDAHRQQMAEDVFGEALRGAANWLSNSITSGVLQIVEMPGNIYNIVSFQNAAIEISERRMADPLVLDLDGDGIELLSLGSGVYWDLDGDGFSESAGWVSPDDGLLAYDANADGIIDTQDELFGNEFEDGFTQLSVFDTDLNGIIDAADTDFSKLLIWRDANSDGISQASELLSLSSWGISQISLMATQTNYMLQGHRISHEGAFVMNGQMHDIVEAWFAFDDTNTRYTEDVQLDFRSLFLPTMRGYGLVADMHVVISQNEDLLQDVLSLSNMTLIEMLNPAFGFKAQIESLMYQWAGVDDVAPASRGQMDARKIGFIEGITGQNYTENGGVPAGNAIAPLEDAFITFYNGFASRFLLQTEAGKEIFVNSGQYNISIDDYTGVFSLDISAIDDIISSLNLTGGNLEFAWKTLVEFIEETMGFEGLSATDKAALNVVIQSSASSLSLDYFLDGLFNTFWGSQLDDSLTGTSQNDRISGGMGNDILYGDAGNDNLKGDDGNDTLNGGSGNDTLTGGAGDDVYVFAAGWGSDRMQEYSGTAQGVDKLRFTGGMIATDLRFMTDQYGEFFIYDRANPANVITFYGSNTSQNVGIVAPSIEIIEFDDSSTIDLTGSITLEGTESDNRIYGIIGRDDTIYGYGGEDDLYGAVGNDTLYGGDDDDDLNGYTGNDILYGDAGNDNLKGDDGNDTLNGGSGNDTLNGGAGDDVLYGGDGLDQIWGGAGADTVRFESASAYSAVDLVKDFNLTQDDVLDVSDLLTGYDPLTDVITDFIQITDDGTHSYLAIDADGGADNFIQIAKIENIVGLTDELQLVTNGNVVV